MDLCLNMIVRNEAPVIAETLANVLDYFAITTWVIHDTGSEDATAQIITDFFAERGIPGRLIHRAWESFGANRQYALADAAGLAEFVLFFDADNRISGEKPVLPESFDALTLNTRNGGVVYPSKLIVRNGAWRWRCVVHEGLYETRPGLRSGHVAGDYFVESRRAGARSRDVATYYKDAQILVKTLENLPSEDEDLRARYTFYAANSWRDAHVPREAAEWYRRRIALGGWVEEVYCSWLGLGIALMQTGRADEAAAAFLSGHAASPDRVECLYQLTRLYRAEGKPEVALIFARSGLDRPEVGRERLFVWRDVTNHWMDFEYLLALKDLGRLTPDHTRIAALRARNAPAHLYALLGV